MVLSYNSFLTTSFLLVEYCFYSSKVIFKSSQTIFPHATNTLDATPADYLMHPTLFRNFQESLFNMDMVLRGILYNLEQIRNALLGCNASGKRTPINKFSQRKSNVCFIVARDHHLLASPVFIINVILNCRAIHPQICSKRQISICNILSNQTIHSVKANKGI